MRDVTNGIKKWYFEEKWRIWLADKVEQGKALGL